MSRERVSKVGTVSVSLHILPHLRFDFGGWRQQRLRQPNPCGQLLCCGHLLVDGGGNYLAHCRFICRREGRRICWPLNSASKCQVVTVAPAVRPGATFDHKAWRQRCLFAFSATCVKTLVATRMLLATMGLGIRPPSPPFELETSSSAPASLRTS